MFGTQIEKNIGTEQEPNQLFSTEQGTSWNRNSFFVHPMAVGTESKREKLFSAK
jgi:hypothetical protein